MISYPPPSKRLRVSPAWAALLLCGALLLLPGSPARSQLSRWLDSDTNDERAGGGAAAKLVSGAVLSGTAQPQQQEQPGDDVLQRFRWAVQYINATQPHGVYPAWRCPNDARVGGRPKEHKLPLIGTTCEPWMARDSITLLHELLLPGTAKALEWSTGSSTTWLLRGHVRHLTSIEHHPKWAEEMQAAIERIFGADFAEERWELHHIPTDPPDSKSSESAEVFADYAAAAFIPASAAGSYDFVSIDGRARVACFPRALQLLKPHGGVLVLDNAERSYYRKGVQSVPKHWLRYSASNEQDTTLAWVSCLPGRCGRA